MLTCRSASTDRMNTSPLNNRPSGLGGVTAALPRPNPDHATSNPMYSAGAHSVNLRLQTPLVLAKKDEALQKAIQYVEKLSDDDKTAFQSAPDIIEHLQEMRCNGKSLISGSLTTRVEKVLQCVKSFMGSLPIFIQHSPEISSLVVGGINCILMVGRSSTYFLSSKNLD